MHDVLKTPSFEVDAARQLRVVYQPIASLQDGGVFGHEALIRGPSGSDRESPAALFEDASVSGTTFDLEMAALRCILRDVFPHRQSGKYFINLSAEALVRVVEARGVREILSWSTRRGFAVNRLVLELTEHERVTDFAALLRAAMAVRALGISFAIDDFGDGRSSLRLWSELMPEFVKIDKFFTKDIGEHPSKVQTLKTIVLMSQSLGGHLIAEGIETGKELAIVRDLGIPFGQGYFLARPAQAPTESVSRIALDEIRRREVAVVTSRSVVRNPMVTAEKLLIKAPSIAPTETIESAVRFFQEHAHLQAVAVVDEERPVGLFTRRTLLEQYFRPFHRELYGNRPCSSLMDANPRLLERSATMEDMVALLTSEDQRYLTDGFIITDSGRYVGLGTGEQLVRSVTEYRVEAARHANPLTFLPGNVPITEHIEKLLASANEFVCCYCDLNHFKPFNDQYGYWRGDEMIRLLADVILKNVARQKDFVGHVGGDDFVALFQSSNWEERARLIISEFNEKARALFDDEALQAGGIEAEDRTGRVTFFPLTTLSIGAVVASPGMFRRPEDVASAAAAAKRRAKRSRQGLWTRGDGERDDHSAPEPNEPE